MAKVTVSVRGDRKLAKQLHTLQAQAAVIGTESLTAWSKDVQDTAKSLVPVRTGALRTGITRRVRGASLTASVGTHTGPFYGHFVEHGTSDTAAQPFLAPAFRRHREIRTYVRVALDARLP